MNPNYKRLCSSEMGVKDSGTSTVDGLQFQDLEREINLILDYSPQEQYYSLFRQPSALTYAAPIIEEKSKYFQQVSRNITDTKRNFLQLYDNINKSIDEMMHQIIVFVEMRERELKTQLRGVAAEKLPQWDRQLSICQEAWVRLQGSTTWGNQNSIDLFPSNELIEEIEFVDAGDLKFEADEYKNILDSLRNLGTIVYNKGSNWSISEVNAFKGIAPKFIFGSSGEKAGQFCRPWGVCSDPTGRILVCDRSNNRIQIFNECGEFLIQFGKGGTNPGEFNRPSGIDVDNGRRIIVADKDNHRIQVFNYYGNYMFQFGAEGKRPGEFMYPWDVATNSKRQIAVSDSKNHRIQLFNEKGGILAIFDAKAAAKVTNPRFAPKVLDSPRGLAFHPNGTLLVTDFNNHRILVLDKFLKKFSWFGCEGINTGQFFRPQGIACNKDGKVAVADSKNYRIQVFDSKGSLLKSFGNQGVEPGQFDCPQGICFHPNQNIIVVDFSNNRVQVF